jgi:polysaccharide export outer membrane protein
MISSASKIIIADPAVVNILEKYGCSPPPEIKLGIGDIVSVSIFEAAAGAFIPTQPIDSHGNIFVPYTGQIPAAATATSM